MIRLLKCLERLMEMIIIRIRLLLLEIWDLFINSWEGEIRKGSIYHWLRVYLRIFMAKSVLTISILIGRWPDDHFSTVLFFYYYFYIVFYWYNHFYTFKAYYIVYQINIKNLSIAIYIIGNLLNVYIIKKMLICYERS